MGAWGWGGALAAAGGVEAGKEPGALAEVYRLPGGRRKRAGDRNWRPHDRDLNDANNFTNLRLGTSTCPKLNP